MAPNALFDVRTLDLSQIEYDIEEIRKANPQRYEFEQLTAILKVFPDEKLIIGYRDIKADEFWVRGHIPGNPLFPGVLMLEAAAQLATFYRYKMMASEYQFMGFAGLDKVRFRGSVIPGDQLIIIAKAIRVSRRMCVFSSQGFVRNKLVFDAEITGVTMPSA